MVRELRFDIPPERVCLLRLSAIGDTCHVVPLLRRLRLAWPATHFTWIIGRLEARLMSLMPGTELIIVDKRADRARRRAFDQELARHSWDVLLHLQLALRASRIARSVRAPVKLGFDRARARELQWLFTNARIAPRLREHVADSFQGFADALGVPPAPMDFSLPLTDEAKDYARRLVPDGARVLAVSPCSSHTLRNWSPERYAAVIEAAHRDHGLTTILCGGPSATEAAMAAAITAACRVPLVDQTGKDTLPQMLALLSRATVLLSPDSGPAHMGTAAGIPVIGLYAATNPVRSGPYHSLAWCVDRYGDAARRFLKREPGAARLDAEDRAARRHGPHHRRRRAGPAGRARQRPAARIARMSQSPNELLAPVSPGELIDKITILAIKSRRIGDPVKLANVRTELDALRACWQSSRYAAADVAREEAELMAVNERLWDIEDRIRDKERARSFDAEFVELARAVYVENDQRAAAKKRINIALGSESRRREILRRVLKTSARVTAGPRQRTLCVRPRINGDFSTALLRAKVSS